MERSGPPEPPEAVSSATSRASTIDIGEGVSTTPVSRSPAAANSAAYSCSVRSRPPGITSMFRSENAASRS